MNLNQWLQTIESLHPSEIDLGLERLRIVSQRMGLNRPGKLVITVAGTNGKGSTVAMLEAIYCAAGYTVGSYTSPHLIHYNERIRINSQMASDATLCASFERINRERAEISLTYFEFGTLAGLQILEEAQVDVAILEVGLGGRLDGVNIVDPDIAVVTSIGLDHQDWLGDTRELIGREKAGIFRSGIKGICGDIDPPESVIDEARRLGTTLLLQGKEFSYEQQDDKWEWRGRKSDGASMFLQNLPIPALDLVNASTVLQVLQCAGLAVSEAHIRQGLASVNVPGRFQCVKGPLGSTIYLDVAHNPHAGLLLAQKLKNRREKSDFKGVVRVVLAMMQDKDHIRYYNALESESDFWYIAAFPQPRCAKAPELEEKLRLAGARTKGPFDNVADALLQACTDTNEQDIILVTGSFMTVAGAMSVVADLGR